MKAEAPRCLTGPAAVLLVALSMVLAMLAGCTGVPSSSSPQVVRTVDGGNDTSAPNDQAPKPGRQPFSLVQDFLRVAVVSSSSARQFLTPEAQTKWQDAPVTIVDDFRLQLPDSKNPGSIQVVATSAIGELDATGVISRVQQGVGSRRRSFSYGLRQVAGEWRIDQLPPGFPVRQTDFEANYHSRPLYFFDTSEARLVPDLRYSALDGPQLATWLMKQMLAGPRPELINSVINEIPDAVAPGGVKINPGDPTMVEMPGVSAIDGNGIRRLAAQLAYTLFPIQFSTDLTLTDVGRPVPIPNAGNTVFSQSDFADLNPALDRPGRALFYLRSGALISGVDYRPVPGSLGLARSDVTAAAVRPVAPGGLRVAEVAGATLLLGNSSDTALLPVPLPGLPAPNSSTGPAGLGRPEWEPDTDAVWVGSGNLGAIYRVGPDRVPRPVATASARGLLPAGRVSVIRFSPDGVRVAVVLDGKDGSHSLFIGSVVRSDSDVRIESWQELSPSTMKVLDVAWRDDTSLQLVAGDSTRLNGEVLVWSVSSDGWDLTALSSQGLPTQAPELIAAAQGEPTVVTAGPNLWVQTLGNWASLSSEQTTPGTAPVYTG